MKKVLSFMLLLAVFGTMLLGGCKRKEPDPISVNPADYANLFTVGSRSCLYNDTLYYYDVLNLTIRYQRLDNVQAEGLPIYNDVLADGADNPFKTLTALTLLLVDQYATALNGGAPELIIAYPYTVFDANKPTVPPVRYYRIVSYNTATGEMRIIQDKIAESIQSLDLYGKTVIYTTNEGDLGYNIHAVQRDGSGYRKMDNPEKDVYRVQCVYDNKIYYRGAGNKLYVCNLDFSQPQYLFDVLAVPVAFIDDGFIYYSTNRKGIEFGPNGMTSVDLCRRSLDKLDVEETVIQNVYTGMNSGEVFYYYSVNNRKIVEDKYYDYGTNTLYSYNLRTGKTTTVYDIGDTLALKCYCALSEKYIVCETSGFADNVTSRTFINLSTKEEKDLPY